MKPMSLTSPESVAYEYGGNKQKIAEAIRMNLINPTVGLMAGLFIDRMRNAAAEEQKPNTTLAQDVFKAPQPPMQQPMQQPVQQPVQGIPAAQMAAAQPQMAQAPQGLESLPAGDVGEYAGGGIVAFDDGGYVPRYAGNEGSFVDRSAFMGENPIFPRPYTAAEKLRSGLRSIYTPRADEISPVLARPAAPANPNVNAYGLPRPDPAANLKLATEQAGNLITVPPELTMEKAIENKEALNRRMGVNENLYQEQKGMLEQDREKLKLDREEAKDMAIFQAGLGIMSGESPFAAVNIGKGSTPAMQTLASEIKDIKKADRELTRAQMALDTAENAYKLDKSKSVENQLENSQARVDKAQAAKAGLVGQIGASLNNLSGATYGADVTAASHKETAKIGAESQRYSADQQLKGALANAAAHKHASDAKERTIQNIMKDRNVGYMDAISLLGEAEHPKDRFNAIHNAITAFNTSVQNDLKILGLDARRTELMKDPQKNKEAIAALDAKEKEIRDVRRKEYGLTQADYDYIEQEGARLAGKNKPPAQSNAPAAPTAGKFSTVAPDGNTYYFDTKEQLDAYKARLARLAKEDKKGQ